MLLTDITFDFLLHLLNGKRKSASFEDMWSWSPTPSILHENIELE